MEKQIFINGEPTTYYITENGRLHNKKTNRWYKGSDSGGYLKYDLRWGNKKYAKFAHRLVAEYFLENLENLPVVNHKDGNKKNNNYTNLEWVSVAENNQHAYKIGLKEKTNSLSSRIKIDEVTFEENTEWKQYQNTNYYISNTGFVKNEKTGNIMKGKITGKGYVEWCFSINGEKHSFLAHRLVYQLFGGELKEGLVINHKDGNKQNNNITNLEQVTNTKNILHSYYELDHKNIKPVGKYDTEGNLLRVYLSCADAARQNPGCYPNLISNVCNGKRNTHKGFVWKYMSKE